MLVNVPGFIDQVQHQTVFNTLDELLCMDVSAEDFQAGLPVLFEQRGAGEPDEDRVGHHGLHNPVQLATLGAMALVHKDKKAVGKVPVTANDKAKVRQDARDWLKQLRSKRVVHSRGLIVSTGGGPSGTDLALLFGGNLAPKSRVHLKQHARIAKNVVQEAVEIRQKYEEVLLLSMKNKAWDFDGMGLSAKPR